jgi:hypothetical protein
MVRRMRFKITHTKTPTNAILSLKVGQTALTLNPTQNLSKSIKFQPMNANLNTNSRFEEQRAYQIEAEQRRSQARTYASVTPIR